MPIAKASYVLSTWSAMSNVLSIFGAFLSDSYLGRFNVITIGSFSSLLVSFLLTIPFFFFTKSNYSTLVFQIFKYLSVVGTSLRR